ncbi:MAG: PTS sugar transporter subunit IIA [Gammaproteobacteria bacterium]
MQLTDILTQSCSYVDGHAESKKRAFELISQLFAETDTSLDPRLLFEALNARERIGNTGINKGVAIPHATIKSIRQPLIALIQLGAPIHYDANDKQPVDLLFAVLIPENPENTHPKQHAMLLKHIELLCQQPTYCQQLRTAKTNLELYERAINKEHYSKDTPQKLKKYS